MDVYLIDESGLTRRAEEELPELLVAGEGVVWVDIPQCRLYEAEVLGRVFGFSEIALNDCVKQSSIDRAGARWPQAAECCME